MDEVGGLEVGTGPHGRRSGRLSLIGAKLLAPFKILRVLRKFLEAFEMQLLAGSRPSFGSFQLVSTSVENIQHLTDKTADVQRSAKRSDLNRTIEPLLVLNPKIYTADPTQPRMLWQSKYCRKSA